MSSVQLIGQGVVAGFSPKWLDTGEAADVDFGGSVPGSGGPHCRRWSPAGWCRTRRKNKKRGTRGCPSLGAGRAAMPSHDSGEFRGGSR
jgi:hypothetical protein